MAFSDTVKRIKEEIMVFIGESDGALNGKKASAKRARKSSLALQKMLKKFREESIEEVG